MENKAGVTSPHLVAWFRFSSSLPLEWLVPVRVTLLTSPDVPTPPPLPPRPSSSRRQLSLPLLTLPLPSSRPQLPALLLAQPHYEHHSHPDPPFRCSGAGSAPLPLPPQPHHPPHTRLPPLLPPTLALTRTRTMAQSEQPLLPRPSPSQPYPPPSPPSTLLEAAVRLKSSTPTYQPTNGRSRERRRTGRRHIDRGFSRRGSGLIGAASSLRRGRRKRR